MSNKNEAISVRTTRLNHLILGGQDLSHRDNNQTKSKATSEGLNREGLLDALCLLYDECSKDGVQKKNKNFSDFVIKCELIL